MSITVYDFHEAPSDYKYLSENGGDEDYIIFFHNTQRDFAEKVANALSIDGDLQFFWVDGENCIFITSHA